MLAVAQHVGADVAPVERFLGDLTVVVVLYGRELAASSTFGTLDADVRAAGGGARPSLLVYDNSPAPGPLPNGIAARWDIRHIHNPSNPGVSAAYRAGATLAGELGRRWLLFFDQDTDVPAGTLDAYATAIAAHTGEAIFAPVLRAGPHVVSPCAFRFPVGRALARVRLGSQSLQGISLLNSGLCVQRSAYVAVGGHDPRIPLDFSDHELVARLRARHACYVLIPAELGHGLSAVEGQSVAQRLRRFRAYCVGARRTPRGVAGRLAARGVVITRGAVLAWRWRHPAFLAAGVRYALGRE